MRLRVEEVARLTVDAIEHRSRQLYVFNGKGSKDRLSIERDALSALESYTRNGDVVGEKSVLSSERATEGKPISVRAFKKDEYYAQRAEIRHHVIT